MPELKISFIDALEAVGTRYYAFDGCSSNNPNIFMDDPPGYLTKESKAEIVCCSFDGNSCSRKDTNGVCRSGHGDDYKVTWEEASQHCEDAGMRLCNTQQELDRCCTTGCQIDNQIVWSGKMEGN